MRLKTILLLIFCLSKAYANTESVTLCAISKGLELINQKYYSEAQIAMILRGCDVISPNAPEVLLLHGLLARHKKEYSTSIAWLEKAHTMALEKPNLSQELALGYELVKNYNKALALYQRLLLKDPNHRTALLGEAHIYRLQNQWSHATPIYENLLAKNPKDIDALNGLAWVRTANKDLQAASTLFQQVLNVQANNQEAKAGLNAIGQTKAQEEAVRQRCNVAMGFELFKKKAPPASVEAILATCENNHIVTVDTLLLHGLVAREKALTRHDFKEAILWFQKAINAKISTDQGPTIQLAVTYEWAKEWTKAQALYGYVLAYEPKNKDAILGKERITRAIASLQPLPSPPERRPLEMRPPETTVVRTSPKPLSPAELGLKLLDEAHPDLTRIQQLLETSDLRSPMDSNTLMLHGLLARYLAKQQKKENYRVAIAWFRLAAQKAKPGESQPLMELAITYEWSNQANKALAIYQDLLSVKPKDNPLLLAKARTLRALYQINSSVAIYENILQEKPYQMEALNGLGETKLANYELDQARSIFNRSLDIHPKNKQALEDLTLVNHTTKNILGLTGGEYVVPPHSSQGTNLFYFRNINATDGLILLATHNTKQIAAGFSSGPTLLPNNSVLLGYQHILAKSYGWQFSQDTRQHDGLPYENRTFGSGSVFLLKRLELYSALRMTYPKPWNTQLIISSLTAYTPLPVNITLTSFWSFQQLGGNNTTYALDFSKEFNKRLFYAVGASYLRVEKSLEFHGRLILPTFKNQAFVGEYSHYLFNSSTFATAGWRFYWA